ncbi:hypothetical protein INT45_012028 [Circinella minor]|uniref:No apical meristem-associated C-terminal domain-containing protein n=1 Tax=Circinella minor TaxID=1195481 RepID=A0A8H7SEL3_9FUNG|nr:hypothetical protein INT45_012028 [Circinella minor]
MSNITITNTESTTPTIDNNQRKKKGSNFTIVEDIALVKAYLDVKNNPTIGTRLIEEGLWSSVMEGFIENCENPLNRDSSSLESRFSSISAKCQFFSASYAKVYAARKRGENEDDWYKQTCDRYADFRPANSGKTFGLRHAWDLLKVEERWKPLFAKERDQVEVMGETQSRPIGKHQAKSAKRKRSFEDEDSTDKQSLEMMRIQQEIDREHIAIEKKRAYYKKITLTHEIMSVDPSTLSGPRKHFYETMQRQIVEEMKDEEEKRMEA